LIDGSGPVSNSAVLIGGVERFFGPLGSTNSTSSSFSFSASGSASIDNSTFLLGGLEIPASAKDTSLLLPDSFVILLGSPIPEPGTLAFVGGVLGLLAWRLRRSRA
jgi:hypothetical protein